MSASHKFWTEGDEQHQEIARRFEEKISMYHPSSVTSDKLCKIDTHCNWATTTVKYYRHDG